MRRRSHLWLVGLAALLPSHGPRAVQELREALRSSRFTERQAALQVVQLLGGPADEYDPAYGRYLDNTEMAEVLFWALDPS